MSKNWELHEVARGVLLLFFAFYFFLGLAHFGSTPYDSALPMYLDKYRRKFINISILLYCKKAKTAFYHNKYSKMCHKLFKPQSMIIPADCR